MTGGQTIAGVGGLGLVLVNFWTGQQRTAISSVLFGGQATTTAHNEVVQVGAELLFVAVATILAGVSSSWGTAMAAVIVALWVLWLTVGPGHLWATGQKSAASQAATAATSSPAGTVQGVLA